MLLLDNILILYMILYMILYRSPDILESATRVRTGPLNMIDTRNKQWADAASAEAVSAHCNADTILLPLRSFILRNSTHRLMGA